MLCEGFGGVYVVIGVDTMRIFIGEMLVEGGEGIVCMTIRKFIVFELPATTIIDLPSRCPLQYFWNGPWILISQF